MAVGTSSGSVTGQDGNPAAAQATVTRLRLGLEAQRPFSFGNPDSDARATLTPSLEIGLRHDGGDAETGFGLGLGGGIVLSHPARGLQAELRERGLLPHAREAFALSFGITRREEDNNGNPPEHGVELNLDARF